jgi:hypothetical protein
MFDGKSEHTLATTKLAGKVWFFRKSPSRLRERYFSLNKRFYWTADYVSDREATFATLEASSHSLSIVSFESRKP